MPNAEEVLGLVKLIEDLEPVAFGLVKALVDKMAGATPDQIAALAHAINTTAITEIDAELGAGAAVPLPTEPAPPTVG